MKVTRSQIMSFLAGLLIFINVQPYFVWSWDSISVVKLGLIFLTLGLLWLNIKRLTITNIRMFFFFLFTLVIMGILNGLNIFGIASTVILVVIPFVSPRFLKQSYFYFHKIYSVVILLSISVMILLLLGINIPYQIIPPLNLIKTHDYYAYPFLVTPNLGFRDFSEVGRFCGPFDEPGVIGTIGLIILFIEKFNLKKWGNIVILISGIMSFSLFFYLGTFIYIIYYVFVNKTRFIYRVLIVASISIFIFFSLDNKYLSGYIWGRVEWDAEKSSISGDNRAYDDLDLYFKSIRGTNIYFWGLGLIDRDLMSSFDNSAGYRNAILRYGFVGFSLYIIFFSALAYKQIGKRKELLLFVLLFLTTLYQRPVLLNIHYIYLFVTFIYLNSLNEQKRDNTKNIKDIRNIRK